MAETAFRTIGELAERCGHYCWLENRLFQLTGAWASARTSADAGVVPAEARVLCGAMSSWHGFVAAQWRERLPVRAGIDAGALIVPPTGPMEGVLSLLEVDPDQGGADAAVLGALDGLAGHILPALLAAYDAEAAAASPVREAPVRALVELIRPRIRLEIAQGLELGRRDADARRGLPRGQAEGRAEVGKFAARLKQALGVDRDIFPDARAS